MKTFSNIVQSTIGGFLSGVEKQNAPIQYRNDENTFVIMEDDFDLKDTLGCLKPVPNTDGVLWVTATRGQRLTTVMYCVIGGRWQVTGNRWQAHAPLL